MQSYDVFDDVKLKVTLDCKTRAQYTGSKRISNVPAPTSGPVHAPLTALSPFRSVSLQSADCKQMQQQHNAQQCRVLQNMWHVR